MVWVWGRITFTYTVLPPTVHNRFKAEALTRFGLFNGKNRLYIKKNTDELPLLKAL